MKKNDVAAYAALELEAHVQLDDVMQKVVQEVGELHEAYTCKSSQEVESEVKDALVNILSVCSHLGIEIEFPKENTETSAEKLLASLSLWSQKVQGLRGRYMRESATKEEVSLATQALVANVLSYSVNNVSENEVIKENSQKFSQRVSAYLPKIDLRDFVQAYPDFPKKGILFQDISPILSNPEAMRYVTFELAKKCSNADVIVGLDARGFLFGIMVATLLQKPFVMVRKKGKLPGDTSQVSYGLEYGKDTIEIQKEAIAKGQRVSIIDDLLATGGTVLAAAKLIEEQGAYVESIATVISLDDKFLKDQAPRKHIAEKYNVSGVLSY